ncbi:MAG: glycosyltransferase family 4 protein [Hydrogenobacter sp.]
MKVAQVGPLIYRIPPEKYGGTELVVYNLLKGLRERGIDCVLFATGDSHVDCQIMPICPPLGWRDEEKIAYYEYLESCHVLSKQEDFDIIHIHFYPHNPQWFFSLPLFKKPVIFTVHSLLEGFKKMYRKFPHLAHAPIVSISNDQRKPLPFANYIATVYNGIDVSIFPYEEKKENFLVFVGRAVFEKGVAEAIEIAKRLGKKLYIIAKADTPQEEEYLSKYVKPQVDGKRVIFLGELTFSEKVEYLSKAEAFIFPMQWREPFGLVMIEAMACGTPVFVTDRGSAKEIVIHGKTGALIKARKKPKFMDEELIQAFVKAYRRYIDKVDPKECRRRVEENFTYQKMTQSYLEAYEKVIKNWEIIRKNILSNNPTLALNKL